MWRSRFCENICVKIENILIVSHSQLRSVRFRCFNVGCYNFMHGHVYWWVKSQNWNKLKLFAFSRGEIIYCVGIELFEFIELNTIF